jgi:hypothetical protein
MGLTMRYFCLATIHLTIFVLSGMLISCSTITLPIQEYTLARSALEFAENNDGERWAPLQYMQAQQVYNQAVQMYENRDYDEARSLFIKSRKLAEKAETTARIKKAKSGEVL